MAEPELPVPFRVTAKHRETHDSWTLRLEPTGESPRARYAPGQFAMLYAFGAGEAPVSVSGDPADEATLVHTVRAVGAVTAAICAAEPGDRIGVRGPYGRPWPVAEAEGRDVVVIAG